jgi:hypothetical protein
MHGISVTLELVCMTLTEPDWKYINASAGPQGPQQRASLAPATVTARMTLARYADESMNPFG